MEPINGASVCHQRSVMPELIGIARMAVAPIPGPALVSMSEPPMAFVQGGDKTSHWNAGDLLSVAA